MKRNILILFIAIVMMTCNEKPVVFVANAYVIYPNPFSYEIQVEFGGLPNGTPVKLKALGVKGNKVFEENFFISDTNRQVSILFPDEEEGNCFLEIEIDGIKFRDKIVKLN